jgi:hypothetical protein
MKNKLLSIVILLSLLQACSAIENRTLEPAINFSKGVSQVPQGYYVFIEIANHSIYSPECQRAPAPVRQLYDFTSSGELWTDLYNLPTAPSSPMVGFFGYGDWHENLYVMETLPFTVPPYGEATVYSVNAEGIAVVEIHGEHWS